MVIEADTAPLGVDPAQLLSDARVLRGHPSGTARGVEDSMAFSVLHGIRPMTETEPLERAGEAFQKMLGGRARFWMVLTME